MAGIINVSEGSPYAGADTVDIIIHGVGAHGASPHRGKDPIVLGSQIVLALQTLVSRELSPRDPGVVTVGSFHSGTKHNIISDEAHLQLTVRKYERGDARNPARMASSASPKIWGASPGLPEDMLPEVIISEESVPPTTNNAELTRRLKVAWTDAMGDDARRRHSDKRHGGRGFSVLYRRPGDTQRLLGDRRHAAGGFRCGDRRRSAGAEPSFAVVQDLRRSRR